MRWIFTLVAVFFSLSEVVAAQEAPPFAQVLQKHCVKCHHQGEKSGGLALDDLDAMKTGGDSGPAIDLKSPEQSLLIEYVSGDTPMMPQEGEPLSKEEIDVLRRWIADGAAWPEGLKLDAPEAPTTDWWSLKPIQWTPPPTLSAELQTLCYSPIDAFLLQKLSSEGLSYAPEAPRRVLIRRLYFDLIGVPPTPEEIAAFEQDDRPLAYERLVERLLASPRYGERWARHWLDLVHYGETHGYDKDKPRPNAWPYRDYVIRAFNEDKPYWRFVQEQLAGDQLFGESRDSIEALGFLSAGPWDFIGHAEVPETKTDGKIARHLDRDDMVSTTIQAFNSLTIQCAQCHNHKFDPISQEDYYSLQAVFAAIDRTERAYDIDPEVAQRRRELTTSLAQLESEQKAAREAIARRLGDDWRELAARRDKLAKAAKQRRQPVEYGYHSEIAGGPDVEKWVQVELPAVARLKEIVLHPCEDDFAGIGAGFGFPPGYRVEISANEDFASPVIIAEQSEPGQPKRDLEAIHIPVDAEARVIRVTATQLAPRLPTDFIFAIAELEAIDDSGANVARGAKVTSLDSIEAPPRWRKTNLTDGKYPHGEDVTAELAEAEAALENLVLASATDSERELLRRDTAALKQAIAELPPQQRAYVGAIHHGSGTFVGTGPSGGKPRPIHILKRGSVTQPAEEVGPGAIAAIEPLEARFDAIKDLPEGERRAALAKWITDPRHPLTWRSIVNRVWQHHFGKGLVASANDFGRKGELPSHPELLDYLAAEFRDGGQSIKDLHRVILLSRAYRQSSQVAPSATALEKDPDNRWLWKAPRRRIEAEALRDSALVLAGEMRWTMYGPSYQDFVIEKPEHSPHYQYSQHDPADPKAFRRSIYRFLVRSQPQPLMAALDCADPSIHVDRRNESVSATQALSLLNDPFMALMAERFAARLESKHPTPTEQIAAGFEEAVGRRPSDEERAVMLQLAEKHGLANVCRLLLNLNEFVFVD